MGRTPASLQEGVGDAMTLTGAVDGVAFLAYIEQVIAPMTGV